MVFPPRIFGTEFPRAEFSHSDQVQSIIAISCSDSQTDELSYKRPGLLSLCSCYCLLYTRSKNRLAAAVSIDWLLLFGFNSSLIWLHLVRRISEGLPAEGNSTASSSSGMGQPTKEDLEALSICGEGVSAREEHLQDGDLATYSAPKSKRVRRAEEGVAAGEEHLEDGDVPTCFAPKFKRARRAVTEKISSDTKLDAGMWSLLDDHLLEKIFTRLPFESLFQVPLLSKAWKARFQSLSFRSEVHCSSSAPSWMSYTPLFVNHKKDLVAYKISSKQWHRLPSHSYLQQNVVRDWWLIAAAGSLLCWACPVASDGTDVFDLHVTNPLTRSWKQLPPRPKMHFPEFLHVSGERSKAYKVIAGTLKKRKSLDDRSSVRVQIFDSADGSWILETYKTVTNCAVEWGGSALRNGVLYMLLYTLEISSGFTLISFDVNAKTWNENPYLCLVSTQDQEPYRHFSFSSIDIRFSQVFSFRSKVMLVVNRRDGICDNVLWAMADTAENCCKVHENFVSVYSLDLHRGLAFEVSTISDSDKMMLNGGGASFGNATGQHDCIYIGDEHDCSGIVYNVATQQWHRWNPVHDRSQSRQVAFSGTPMNQWQSRSVVYQPGLNPFREV